MREEIASLLEQAGLPMEGSPAVGGSLEAGEGLAEEQGTVAPVAPQEGPAVTRKTPSVPQVSPGAAEENPPSTTGASLAATQEKTPSAQEGPVAGLVMTEETHTTHPGGKEESPKADS